MNNIMIKISKDTLKEALEKIDLGAKTVTLSLPGVRSKDGSNKINFITATNTSSAAIESVCTAVNFDTVDGKATITNDNPQSAGFSISYSTLKEMVALTTGSIIGFTFYEDKKQVEIATKEEGGAQNTLQLPTSDVLAEISLDNKDIKPLSGVKLKAKKIKSILKYLRVATNNAEKPMYGLLKNENGIVFYATNLITMALIRLEAEGKVMDGVDLGKYDFTGVDPVQFGNTISAIDDDTTVAIMFYGTDEAVKYIRINTGRPTSHIFSVLATGTGSSVYAIIDKSEGQVDSVIEFSSSDMQTALKVVSLSAKQPWKSGYDLNIKKDSILVSDIFDSEHGAKIPATCTLPEGVDEARITINPKEFSTLVSSKQTMKIGFNYEKPIVIIPSLDDGVKMVEALVNREKGLEAKEDAKDKKESK